MVSLQEWESRIDLLIKSLSAKEGCKLQKAVDFAKIAHEGDFRKNTKEPYIVHPYEVCIVASGVTDDVDVLAAALLHDVVEDTDYTQEDIRREFGDRIAGFVADESEDKMDNIPKAMSWIIRKERFLNHLKKAPVESQTICMADKISNLRSTYEMYMDKGDAVWDGFNQKDPKRHAWYYRSIAESFDNKLIQSQTFKEYCQLFEKIFGSRIIFYSSDNGGLMITVNELKTENENVVVRIQGRITSTTADELFNGLTAVIENNPGKNMVYDLDGLEMISSAGLRVFLKIKKMGCNFKIVNASSDVYEVFDMTGFVQMFDISKAYRKMSVEGCTIIGEGAKGTVYKIDDETIIKVYKEDASIDEIINERECAKKALIMGIPTAIPFDIVRVGDRLGSVFELIAANSLTKSIINEPQKAQELIKEYARVLKDMHSLTDDGSYGISFPSIKDDIVKWTAFAKENLDEKYHSNIQKFENDIIDAKSVLHGDCHPNNVMCTRDEMILIDMDTLCTGDPYADLAVVYTALIGYKMVEPDNSFIPMSLEESSKIWECFIRNYLEDASEEKITEVVNFCEKFCYLRLYRRGVRKEANPEFAKRAKALLMKAFE